VTGIMPGRGTRGHNQHQAAGSRQISSASRASRYCAEQGTSHLKRRFQLIALMLASLSACSPAVEPDALARWAAEKGVLVDSVAAAQGLRDTRISQSQDGHGYLLTPKDKNGGPPARIYFVPLSAVGDALEKRLRAAIFPSGVATFSPAEEEQAPRKIAESELDGLYLQLLVIDGGSMCDDLTKPCAAAGEIKLVGKLKGYPLLGTGRRIRLDPMLIGGEALTKDKLSDAGATCGFDPERDRIPRHIGAACDRIRLMDWGARNGFTLSRDGGLFPLTPAALEGLLGSMPDGALYPDKALLGDLEEVK